MIGKNPVLPLPVRLLIVLVFAALLMSGGPAKAAEITLAWDANAEPDLSGYKVYSGTASRSYTGSVDVGNWTSCVMGGLEPARTFVLDAIAHGKAVVTANKALLAHHGAEILAAAEARGVGFQFEARTRSAIAPG